MQYFFFINLHTYHLWTLSNCQYFIELHPTNEDYFIFLLKQYHNAYTCSLKLVIAISVFTVSHDIFFFHRFQCIKVRRSKRERFCSRQMLCVCAWVILILRLGTFVFTNALTQSCLFVYPLGLPQVLVAWASGIYRRGLDTTPLLSKSTAASLCRHCIVSKSKLCVCISCPNHTALSSFTINKLA